MGDSRKVSVPRITFGLRDLRDLCARHPSVWAVLAMPELTSTATRYLILLLSEVDDMLSFGV
jgi:hypothetical protein